MNDLRHVCVYCKRKRIARKMRKIKTIYPLDNLVQGALWACWFRNYSENTQDCYSRYLKKRSAEFYYWGDKYASEQARTGEPPFVGRA